MPMDSDITALRALCDETAPREQRAKLIESYARHIFMEPEYHVVFESICALFSRGPITASQLGVHLTRRGFPDIDAGKYCAGIEPKL